jgi:serine/threonine-protein kinase
MAAAGSMPRPSDIIAGSYRVERTIGTGGMGHVVAATDIRTNAPVAIKLLGVKDDDTAVQRFFREARASMNIRCDHVVRVIEVGSVHGAQPFMVMERLTGQDLAVMVRGQKALPVQDVVDIAVDTCDALAHAHASGVVHRDIKLSNLFYCEPQKIIKVLDFGISKSEDREVWERTLTRTGADAVLGSPPFMSPEQIRRPKEVDGRTDIWAMGIVLYRLMCGRMPFDGETVGELFANILERDPTPLTSMAPHVSPAIAAIIHKCLARDRQQRYANVGQIARDLLPYTNHKAAAEDAIRVQPPGTGIEEVGTMSLDGPMPQLSSSLNALANINNAGSSGGYPAQPGANGRDTGSGRPPLPFSQPPPRASVPSAPQITQQPSRPSIPPGGLAPSHNFTPSGSYAPPQPGNFTPSGSYIPQSPASVPSIVSQMNSMSGSLSSSQMGAQRLPPGIASQYSTGPQPTWTGSGATLAPEVFTAPGGTLATHPRRWPWIVVSFAALGLASVLAWGAASSGPNTNGNANGTNASGSSQTTLAATTTANTVSTTTTATTATTAGATSSANPPPGTGAINTGSWMPGQPPPTAPVGPKKTPKLPGQGGTSPGAPGTNPGNGKPGGGLHDNPYAQQQ